MTILTILLTVVLSLNPCYTGTLSQYAERPTREVLYNRSIKGRTAYTIPANWHGQGYLAVEDCRDLGKTVMVYWRGHKARMLIFDCSGDAPTSSWMKRNNILGEVDYWTARDWGMLGRGIPGATVCYLSPIDRHPRK